jgi:hypothetical protein
MAALDFTLRAGEQQLHQLVKRKNWAGKHPGVILVFAIVATVVILLVSLALHKKLTARRAAKATV